MKHTQDAMEKENLRLALDAMRVSGHTEMTVTHRHIHIQVSAAWEHSGTRSHPRAISPQQHSDTSV